MRQVLFPIFTFLFSAISLAQPFNYEWAVQIGGNQEEIGRSIVVDKDNNIISSGTFFDTIDIDPGPGVSLLVSGGFADNYIQKLDPNGNLIWGKAFSGNLAVVARTIATDVEGNIYLSGNFKGTTDFDPGPGVFTLTSNGQIDIFIVKLNGNGDFVWAKALSSPSFDRTFGLTTDQDLNVYASGYFADSIDINPGLGVDMRYAQGSFDAFVIKLDSLGDFVWANNFGGTSDDIALNVVIDDSNNVIVGGYYSEVVDFDPGPAAYNLASNGGYDIFIQKLDANGNLKWAISEGGPDDQSARALACDHEGNIYFTGNYMDTIDFDPSTSVDFHASAGGVDIFLQKLNANGGYEWTKSIGGSYDERGRGIAVDEYGFVYVVGDFGDTVDFDPSTGIFPLESDTVESIFVIKFRQNGNFVWAEKIGSAASERGYGIDCDPLGNVYITGFFQDTVDFDPGSAQDIFVSNSGSWDACVVKFNQCLPTISAIQTVGCSGYTSPSGNYFWTSDGVYYDTLYASNQCGGDSIIQVQLSVQHLDTAVVTVNNTILVSTASNVSYQWLDCFLNYAPISGETQQQFTAASNGSYAVEVSTAECVDTSACILIDQVNAEQLGGLNVLRISPNPSSGKFLVDLGETMAFVEVTVRDISGKLLLESTYKDLQEITVEVNEKPGVYFLSIRSENEQGTFQLIKQ